MKLGSVVHIRLHKLAYPETGWQTVHCCKVNLTPLLGNECLDSCEAVTSIHGEFRCLIGLKAVETTVIRQNDAKASTPVCGKMRSLIARPKDVLHLIILFRVVRMVCLCEYNLVLIHTFLGQTGEKVRDDDLKWFAQFTVFQ